MDSTQFEKLNASNLEVQFATQNGLIQVVSDVSFCVRKGERLGIIGESGSGKTVTALSLLGFERGKPGIVAGSIELNSSELLPDWKSSFPNCESSKEIAQQKKKHWGKWHRELSANMKSIRGIQIGIAFQDPKAVLDPLFSIGRHIGESVKLSEKRNGKKIRAKGRRKKAIEWLKQVEIDSPEKAVDQYPHQLSGGMLQRVVLAIALASKPDLLIVDEPTTGLDMSTGEKILSLLEKLCAEEALTLIVISHDLLVIRRLVDNIIVMYAGQIVEKLAKEELESVKHPYTRALMDAHITEDLIHSGKPLPCLTGEIPKPGKLITGCRFHPRCPLVREKMEEVDLSCCTNCPPGLIPIKGIHDRAVRCWKYLNKSLANGVKQRWEASP